MKSTERRTYTTRIAALEAEKLALETQLIQKARQFDQLQERYEQHGRALLEAKLWTEKARELLKVAADPVDEYNSSLAETIRVMAQRELMVDTYAE